MAGLDTPSLDRGLRLLTTAANGSALWLAIAGTIAALGGQRGRRAAVRGLASIAVTSAAVNQGLRALRPALPSRRGAAASSSDTLSQLQKLGGLKAQGILTEAKFQAQKAKILG